MALPDIAITLFHVEQRPVQQLAAVTWPAIQQIRGVGTQYLYRKTPGQIGQPVYRFAIQVYRQCRATAFDTDRK